MTRSTKLFVADMLESMVRIEQYTSGMSYESFKENGLVVDAVVRNLEIIGEAARNIPNSMMEQYSDVSWHRMIALRNILIHDYFGVDMEIVWKIITRDLPKEKPVLESVYKNL